MKAKFIGESSMGFVTGCIYDIYTDCQMIRETTLSFKPCLCIFDKNSFAGCPYENLEAVLQNWILL